MFYQKRKLVSFNTQKKVNSVDESLIDEGVVYTKGKVIKVEGHHLFIQAENQSGCTGCSAQNGCGTSALAKLFNQRSRKPLILENTVNAELNDFVELSIKESHLVKHSVMAYGVPLVSLIGCSWLFLEWSGSDLFSAVGGLLGILLGWFWTHKVYRPVLPKLERVLSD